LTIQAKALRVTCEAKVAEDLVGGGADDVLLVPLADVKVGAVVAREAWEQRGE
jgi:hypothetical protein